MKKTIVLIILVLGITQKIASHSYALDNLIGPGAKIYDALFEYSSAPGVLSYKASIFQEFGERNPLLYGQRRGWHWATAQGDPVLTAITIYWFPEGGCPAGAEPIKYGDGTSVCKKRTTGFWTNQWIFAVLPDGSVKGIFNFANENYGDVRCMHPDFDFNQAKSIDAAKECVVKVPTQPQNLIPWIK